MSRRRRTRPAPTLERHSDAQPDGPVVPVSWSSTAKQHAAATPAAAPTAPTAPSKAPSKAPSSKAQKPKTKLVLTVKVKSPMLKKALAARRARRDARAFRASAGTIA